jgi:hypothetical protein
MPVRQNASIKAAEQRMSRLVAGVFRRWLSQFERQATAPSPKASYANLYARRWTLACERTMANLGAMCAITVNKNLRQR